MTRSTIFGEIEVSDAHIHFFSRKFFQTLAGQSQVLDKLIDPFPQMADMTGWVLPPEDPADLAGLWIGELDRHGISKAMLMASVPGDEDSIAAAVKAFPDRIVGGFFIDPTKDDAESRGRKAFDELGLQVACLFPAMHHFSMAENEGAHALAALASERSGKAVFVHCGALSVGARKKFGLKSPFDMRHSNPLDIYRLAAEFSKTNFIIPHFGAGMFRETLMLADLCPNIYIDTSSSNNWIRYQANPISLQTVFKQSLEVAGHKRLLFGTDSSFFPRGWNASVFETQVSLIAGIGAGREQAEDILGGNLRRLLS